MDNSPEAADLTAPNNLPAELTSFVGREPQLADLRRLLARSRLITLTGPGGTGKTRLALRLAAGVLDRFGGGVWLVELAAISDPSLVDGTVAAACGVRESGDRSVLDSLVMKLGDEPTMLVLDGAEHLVEACGLLAGRMLREARALTVVVTSREPLGIGGEIIWRTPSLTLPATEPSAAKQLHRSESVRLFLARAKLAQPAFNLEAADEMELAEVCIRLEGLPLAIELAASLTGAMTVHEIHGRLSDRYRLLTGGARHALPRQKTLQQAIDSSYDLLTTEERDLFARLSVFLGGFDANAAQSVGSMDGEDVLPVLIRLVNKSLVIAGSRSSRETRYSMLDTIREYAVDKLPPGESRSARRRHAAHYLEFARNAARQLRTGDQALWLDRVEEETPNLRLAMAWYENESPDQLMEVTGWLHRYWYVRGKVSEGLEWLDRALALDAEQPVSRLPALQARGRLRRQRGDYEGAARDAIESVDIARSAGDNRYLLGGLTTLGVISASLARWEDARVHLSEALRMMRVINDPAQVGGGINNLALVESSLGNHDRARSLMQEAMEIARQSEDGILIGNLLESFGRIERRAGDAEAARRYYLAALAPLTEFEDLPTIADVLDGLALISIAEGDATRGLVLAAAGARQRSLTTAEKATWDRGELDASVAAARLALSAGDAAAAAKRGEAMELAEAVAYARREPAARNGSGGLGLTSREMQVASLIKDGLTNSEIAGRLKIALRTADAHVEHIRNKLGVHSRAQIAVWAHGQPPKA